MAGCCAFFCHAPLAPLLASAVSLRARRLSLVDRFAGACTRDPGAMRAGLGEGAAALLARAFDGVEPDRLVDYHTHVIGVGAGGTGNFINPVMRSWWRPLRRLKLAIYMSAAGIDNLDDADREFLARLSALARNVGVRVRHQLLAFDKHYNPDGTPNLRKTEFYVPNQYTVALAREWPDLFIPAMSIHPYRADALDELERLAAEGVRMLKWLPNAMGIDPSSPRCDPFYEAMRRHGVVLLSHGGEEKAVEAEEDQRFGNPLLLRRPLEHGVRVVVAHCAGLGTNEDFEKPGRPRVSNFDLFMRLFDDARYEGLLFADISAMTQRNRIGGPLTTILDRSDLHARLVNGSDYPLPAMNFLISTSALARAGYITADERRLLNEIYAFNPLAFDFALKRTMRSPATGARMAASVFMENPGLAQSS